ncbi:MAG: DUF4398 domain-containing protein [Treponema sp.]|nr:DUF4398 domain-containing protein [Treponema sp.]
MKKLIVIFPVVLVFGLIFAACATPPTDEMNKAYDAVTRAENDADAVRYAGNTLVQARAALTKMQSEADAKRYDSAKSLAAEAISNADKAIADGKTGAARARDEAANLINSLSGPLTETSNAIDAARKVPNIKLDFNAISADLNSARQAYSTAQQSLTANNFTDASAKAQNVRTLLAGINAQLSAATQAVSRKQ